MIIGNDGIFNLAYCSNIHPGENWLEVFTNLRQFVPALKLQLAPKQSFGIGLRLSNQAAEELLQGDALKIFHDWLSENQLYVFTINGFPYGGFHHQRVKEQVYAPDWLTTERRDYCLKLVAILNALTGPEGESGFSTSPLSYKPWLNDKKTKIVYEKSSLFMAQIVTEMIRIRNESGKFIHIDIEPEPDCLIETIEEAVQFFEQWLIPIGSKYLVETLKISPAQAEDYLRSHVCLCYDICHSSVEFETPSYVFKRLANAGIKIGKIQISAALKSVIQKAASTTELEKHLAKFADPVYLHQVVEHYRNGDLHHVSDLSPALKDLNNPKLKELRTHFHVPLFIDQYEMLESTQNDVRAALRLLQKNKATHHLEIETYTWDVLPSELKLDVVSSIKREYQWVLQQFNNKGA